MPTTASNLDPETSDLAKQHKKNPTTAPQKAQPALLPAGLWFVGPLQFAFSSCPYADCGVQLLPHTSYATLSFISAVGCGGPVQNSRSGMGVNNFAMAICHALFSESSGEQQSCSIQPCLTACHHSQLIATQGFVKPGQGVHRYSALCVV